MRKPPITSGTRFGRLIVIERENPTDPKYPRYMCRCDCGEIKAIATGNLTNGKTNSCGCIKREMLKSQNTTHGKSNAPEYVAWNNILRRCSDTLRHDYERYGGRGITVCDRWRSFANFYADMGPRPSKKHSIDRINNEGHYEPSNCRWASPKEQANNRRKRRWHRRPRSS